MVKKVKKARKVKKVKEIKEIPEAKKVILNNDDVGDSYVIANADDTVSFWRQGTEYMRFE